MYMRSYTLLSRPLQLVFFSPLVLCIVQAKPATVSDCFVENISCALELVQMPASEEDVSKFFAGVPPLPQQEEEGEEGEEEEEGGRLHPPKAKRSKSEEKALNVSSLHVSGLY